MKTVLVVEDDQTLQKAYATLLRKEGYHVEVATDGVAALEKARQREPDLILLDMLMPRMNGLDFLRVYNMKAHPHVRVIAFSNNDTPKWVEQATDLGVARYLAKYNRTPRALLGIVKETLLSAESPQAAAV